MHEIGGWYEAMRKLYEKIKINNLNSTDAKFVSVIALRWEDSSYLYSEVKLMVSFLGLQEEKMVLVMILFLFHRVIKKLFGQMNHDKKILIDHRYQAFKKIAKLHLKNN